MFSFDLAAPIRDWLPTALYPGFRPGLPDILLGRLPPEIAEMAGHPFKSWIIENGKEADLLRKRLAEPLPVTPEGHLDFISGPDSAVRKKGRGAHPTEPLVAIYSSPGPGWPLLVLTSLPVHAEEMERGRYAWEACATDREAVEHAQGLLSAIAMPVRILSPDSLDRH